MAPARLENNLLHLEDFSLYSLWYIPLPQYMSPTPVFLFHRPSLSSITGILIITSLIVSILSWTTSGIGGFGMDAHSIADRDWVAFGLQLLLFQFLHAGVLHWANNSLMLLLFGTQVEKSMGEAEYASFFIFGTCFVAGALLLFSTGITIGISGFVMAVLTYIGMDMYERRDPQYRAVILFLAINIFMGLDPSISFVGHLAGAIW